MWFAVGIIVCSVVLVIALYRGFRDTEEGWEDEKGYHKGKQP